MKMSKRTLKALEESIQHWDRVCYGSNETTTDVGCALCGLYNLYQETGFPACSPTCPVKRKTGKDQCINTPWYSVCYFNTPATKEAELIFLLGLLPEGHPWREQI